MAHVKRRTARVKARRSRFVLWFRELGVRDVSIVGGKNASLGEMYRLLTPKGVAVPNGFATSACAYRAFLKGSKVDRTIRAILKDLDTTNILNLQKRGKAVRQ